MYTKPIPRLTELRNWSLKLFLAVDVIKGPVHNENSSSCVDTNSGPFILRPTKLHTDFQIQVIQKGLPFWHGSAPNIKSILYFATTTSVRSIFQKCGG